MANEKATLYLDPTLRKAIKIVAVTTSRTESEVVSEAVEAYLQSGHAASAQRDLQQVLKALSKRPSVSDDEAMNLAVREVHAARKSKRR